MGILKGLNRLDNIIGSPLKKVLVNNYIKFKFGGFVKMLELKIDKEEKEIFAKIRLKGEDEDIEIKIDDFTVENDILVINEVKSDKKWVDLLLKKFLVGRKHKIPREILSVLDIFE